MKRIVVPFEGTAYRRELLEFVRLLNERSKLLLTVAGNGARIKRYCGEHDIDCRVHADKFDPAPGEIGQEMRFADLLLLSSTHFFEAIDKRQPNVYMREVLHQAECPVLLVPENPKLPGEFILAYDGSAASVHAIRQFAYLFPEFSRVKTTLVCISEKEDPCIPNEGFIREFCERHYKNFRMLRLGMRTDMFYDAWIGMMDSPWLISGGCGRTDWSQLVHHRFMNRFIQGHRVPLFVARG